VHGNAYGGLGDAARAFGGLGDAEHAEGGLDDASRKLPGFAYVEWSTADWEAYGDVDGSEDGGDDADDSMAEGDDGESQ
jgi:hypothetical protein